MKKTAENSVILVKNGEPKKIQLPENGKLVIQITDGMPVRVEEKTSGRRFEDL